MNKLYIYITFLMILLGACTQEIQISKEVANNPFFKKYDAPFQVPPFDKIKETDYLPAFKEAFRIHDLEIEAIVKNGEKPTFANTIEALEYSGNYLSDISYVFYNLLSSNTNDSMQKIANEVSPLISKHSDNIIMNLELFKRVKELYDSKTSLNLSLEQSKLLDETYKRFIRSGASLTAEQQEKLRNINSELSTLGLKFGDNLLKETNGFKLIIEKKEDLVGLPESIIDAAAQTAKELNLEGKWVFSLKNPSVMPFLQYSSKRELREKIWRAYTNRGNNANENDNKEVIKKIVELRILRANLLGFKSHADFILSDNMAKTPDNVYKLLHQLWEPAIKVATNEAKEMQAIINKEGGKFKLEPWDWRYYAEKLRKQKYDLDEEQLRPYFQLDNVKKGVFTVSEKLFGLTFKENKNLPKYHADAEAYEVSDIAGNFLGILYMDFHPRDSKRGGAWMDNFRGQYKKDGKDIRPVITVVCNFSKPTADKPALLNLDEVSTLFHEFGHALHGMLSKCTYPSISGTSVSRDFVELPSQIMENWYLEEDVLKIYAKHYKTGEILPKELLTKLKNSQLFNQGFETTEYLAASLLDMNYHTLTTPMNDDVNTFEAKAMTNMGLISEIIPRYKSTYFNHIFNSGYSAGYYSYIWAAILDADAFEAFKQNGIFDTKTADAFRTNILEKGGTEDAMELYRRFRGAEPDIKPLLKRRGLLN